MKVNICGVPHKIVECEDNFNVDMHFGQIDYKACEIRVNKDMTVASKKETICHEMLHGIFVHLGYNDYAQDEKLVQALGNAIYQGFEIKVEHHELCRDEADEINEVLDKIIAEIDKIYERENHSFDCLDALDELKGFIEKSRAESEE